MTAKKAVVEATPADRARVECERQGVPFGLSAEQMSVIAKAVATATRKRVAA